MEGIKHDGGKTRFSLLVPEFIKGMADVMTDGAKKYGDRNWEGIEDHSRVLDAHMRHMFAQWMGEDADAQSGHDHLFHVACNAMMLWKLKQGNTRSASESLGSTTNRDWFITAVNNSAFANAMFQPETESTDINTENVKIRGDLIAIRWMGDNVESFKLFPYEIHSVTHDNMILFDNNLVIAKGDWLVFYKSTARFGMYNDVSDEVFNQELKHLFE